MRGKQSSIGFVHSLNPIAVDDGLLVAMVKQMGFIPFVRTNIPINNMYFETCNNVYGRASNPWNKDRTPGGSSGGEGGLVCAGGSIFGVGSDIADRREDLGVLSRRAVRAVAAGAAVDVHALAAIGELAADGSRITRRLDRLEV